MKKPIRLKLLRATITGNRVFAGKAGFWCFSPEEIAGLYMPQFYKDAITMASV